MMILQSSKLGRHHGEPVFWFNPYAPHPFLYQMGAYFHSICGSGIKILGFPMMKRHTKEQIAKNPEP